MADYSANVAKMTRLLAIAHIVIGTLLICFGIADRLVESYHGYAWTGYAFFGVWIGIWMCITGGLGIPGSGRLRTSSRNAFAGIFMGFSITSAVFGGIIIICYSVVIATVTGNYDYYGYSYYDYYDERDSKLAILAVMLILGIAAFVVGISAAVCCCLLKPCTCCTQQQGEQMMYNANPPSGYVMTEVSGGFSVAVPVQTGSGMVAARGVQPPMVLVPASGVSGTQPVIVQAASSDLMTTVSPTQQIQPQFVQINPPYATSATDSQPQQAEMPHSYGRGGYMPLQKEEID